MKTVYQAPRVTCYSVQSEALMSGSNLKVNTGGETLVGTPQSRRHDAWDFTDPTHNLFED